MDGGSLGQEHRRFVSHNVDPGSQTHARQVLWEQEQLVVSTWDVHSVSPVAGQSVVHVSLEMHQDSPNW
jgi:hypothetical protein